MLPYFCRANRSAASAVSSNTNDVVWKIGVARAPVARLRPRAGVDRPRPEPPRPASDAGHRVRETRLEAVGLNRSEVVR